MKMLPSVTRIVIILIVTLVGALWLYIKGPIPVIRGTTELEEIVPFWYMILAFPVLGMLVADLLASFMKYGLRGVTLLLAAQIFVLVVISSIRLSMKIPISGHAFLFAFLISNRFFRRDYKNPISIAELALTAGLLILIGYIKLAWWQDLLTLSVGVVAGVLLALMTSIFRVNSSRVSKAAT